MKSLVQELYLSILLGMVSLGERENSINTKPEKMDELTHSGSSRVLLLLKHALTLGWRISAIFPQLSVFGWSQERGVDSSENSSF